MDNLTYGISSPFEGKGSTSIEGRESEKGQTQGLPLQDQSGRGESCVHPDHLEKVIKMSKCGFIYDLPNGLETEI